MQENPMQENKTNETFTYTYSAKEQEEIRRIRQKYLPPAETPLDRLRRLDRSATRKGTAAGVAAGVAGCLLLGVGMCCTMVWVQWFAPGVAVGVAGIALIAGALPLCRAVTRRARQKQAPEVLRLTGGDQGP